MIYLRTVFFDFLGRPHDDLCGKHTQSKDQHILYVGDESIIDAVRKKVYDSGMIRAFSVTQDHYTQMYTVKIFPSPTARFETIACMEKDKLIAESKVLLTFIIFYNSIQKLKHGTESKADILHSLFHKDENAGIATSESKEPDGSEGEIQKKISQSKNP